MKAIFVILLLTHFIVASNYNSELIRLHRDLGKFNYQFHAMPEAGGYYHKHEIKHFIGKNKPIKQYTGNHEYGRRNSAAIVDIITYPNHWEICDATDEFPKGTINYKLGLWNEQWKLFMVFGYVSTPIRGQKGGVLVSAYVEKRGKEKIRCNWGNKNYKEFQLLINKLKLLVPFNANTHITQPVTVGATIAGVYVFAEELFKFLGACAVTYVLP